MIFDLNRTYPQFTESQTIIRFQDCDPLAHLNNAKYFDYFFNAREDQILKTFAVKSAYFLADFPVDWVVYNHQIAYVRSANLSEWVTIRTAMLYFDSNTVIEEYCMFDEAKTHLKTLLWTTSKCIDKTGKKAEHPREVMQFLAKICPQNADYQSLDFQKRIKEIKGLL
ncbi:MAG: acyl-CoA thioesterase [Microscillaceae bacterium]|jgi:acyl-CoA thioester hydrolase|nr:acyl-CoA thioesterase [Microscillaceae bacterium]